MSHPEASRMPPLATFTPLLLSTSIHAALRREAWDSFSTHPPTLYLKSGWLCPKENMPCPTAKDKDVTRVSLLHTCTSHIQVHTSHGRLHPACHRIQDESLDMCTEPYISPAQCPQQLGITFRIKLEPELKIHGLPWACLFSHLQPLMLPLSLLIIFWQHCPFWLLQSTNSSLPWALCRSLSLSAQGVGVGWERSFSCFSSFLKARFKGQLLIQTFIDFTRLWPILPSKSGPLVTYLRVSFLHNIDTFY